MASFYTTNPYTGHQLERYERFTDEQVRNALRRAAAVFPVWSVSELAERSALIKKTGTLFLERREELSELMTAEMGKPIAQSRSEIDKCARACDFYAENAALFLSDAMITTDASESFISYDPMGTVLAIMPWNFPFWQVIRCAAPTLTAGNTVLLKHAENVTGCALAMEALFTDAGYPQGCFQAILADHGVMEAIIGHEVVRAVSLTGSEKAGRAVAAIAGRHLKKTVLELGGNNACIVWEDADLDACIETMVEARMQNNGQSCIAAKRFIVCSEIYAPFLSLFTAAVRKLAIGDPMDERTYLSVMARTDLAETLYGQVERSVAMGAQVVLGHTREEAYYAPTVLTEVHANMPVFREETFGPVAAIIKVRDRQEALDVAADSDFGLGTMLFTKDVEAAKRTVFQVPDGSLFINEMVRSDPRLPFGGTKNSGYGRELSKEGMMEFVNKKTVYIK